MNQSSSKKKSGPEVLPVLPVRDLVVFPLMTLPLLVGREGSLRAVDDALARDKMLVVVTQRNDDDDPGAEDLYEVGTVAEATQFLKMPDGSVRVVVEGQNRANLLEIIQTSPFITARVDLVPESSDEGIEVEALMRNIVRQFEQIVQLGQKIPPETIITASNLDSPGRLADLVSSYVDFPIPEKQQILELNSPKERLQRLSMLLAREGKILEIDREIETRVREEVNESQREYFLREKMKQIQERLGERDPIGHEIEAFRQRIAKAGMPAEAQEKAVKELERLEKMPPIAPEGTVIRTYLDWLTDLPWKKTTRDQLDVGRAEKILDEDHYGLKKVKERVVEFLAVRKLSPSTKGPILCFIGPPGVGKTSIGKSIARAMGRKFIRLSLGGVRDEAEIRGHRRTYIGSMPGRILQTIRRIGVRNPVFMLDEIDKIGIDFRGDPSAALLEALDPEQNNAFSDHYLEVSFDLSNVFFIATGNLLDPIPAALRDRMEVIEFPGYIEEEKLCIGKQFLVPKQVNEHGLKDRNIELKDSALKSIVREYTREAGVRNLEREIASVCRKVARNVVKGKKRKVRVTARALQRFLGPPRYQYGVAEEKDEVAVATGLAWSSTGGDVLSIEVGVVPGKGRLTLTGQLGETMQESAQAALSYTRRLAPEYQINGNFFEKVDIHVHVPSGAIPKDGPSSGVAMATALVSAVTKIPVRKDVAMTGEITLRGKVLPIGGVKEKILAAHRAGIKEVILPRENEKDLTEIPRHVLRGLQLHFVISMEEILKLAFVKERNGRTRRTRKS